MPVYHKPSVPPYMATKCSVCMQMSTNQQILPCNHTFCQPCLSQQLARLTTLMDGPDTISITCPYCKDFFFSSMKPLGHKADLRRRRTEKETRRPQTSLGHVSEYRDQYQKHAGDRKQERCQPCAEGSIYELAVFWCQNCSEYMCSMCAKYHSAMRMSRDHIVKTIRDKERYEHIRPRIQSTRPRSAREAKPFEASTAKEVSHYYCEPCNLGKMTKFAKYLCDNCKEQLCDDCARCHRNMKMAKSHKIVPMKDVLSTKDTAYSLGVKCDRHAGEVLSLYCKQCKTSCCSICAVTAHSRCGKATKLSDQITCTGKAEDGKKEKAAYYAWDDVAKDLSNGKTVSFGIKPTKMKYPKKKMELRKKRIELQSSSDKDWVISLALLTCGDILVIQLYEPTLKMISPDGTVLSSCRFYGDPWSVSVYNDSLALVSFSDRKQLQLINITRSGLNTGKKFSTRHKCMAICFAKSLIAASCWDACIHLMDITGREISSVDLDSRGDRLFTSPEYIAANKDGSSLYVSDYKRNSITGLTVLPSKIKNTPEFVFKHKELQGPKGIAVDTNGIIYVSGMSSRNIFRLAPSGDVIQVFRRREDTEYYEAIAVSPDVDKILVSAYEDNSILEYKLKNDK
ncbi:hypothetical protein MAR_005080 [Mya arenaria]|uniref:Uncharacterized protein n=1 Tax=Mya arenaria TaxID=6604 RepID=A0ABY7EYF6_MYAAR|nr:uncharacterized protein LOC128246432 [Mya arenaria]WAR14975.1 hypothetical protein MAR_005080 [Mya arenaria]